MSLRFPRPARTPRAFFLSPLSNSPSSVLPPRSLFSRVQFAPEEAFLAKVKGIKGVSQAPPPPPPRATSPANADHEHNCGLLKRLGLRRRDCRGSGLRRQDHGAGHGLCNGRGHACGDGDSPGLLSRRWDTPGHWTMAMAVTFVAASGISASAALPRLSLVVMPFLRAPRSRP